MTKKKAIKAIKITLCVFLAIIMLISAVLFFPLTGKKHTEIWSADQKFDLEKIQTVKKREKILKY